MAASPSWLPRREADRLVWLQNFVLKLATYVGTAGIVAGDVTNATGYRDLYQWILNRTLQVRTVSQELTEWKDILTLEPIGTPIGPAPSAPVFPAPPIFTPVAGIWDLIVAMADRIRNTAGYTTAIGEDLGIEPPASLVALGDPTCTATALPNSEVRLDFVKGDSDGVIVESQRAGETTWTVLGSDRFSPYLDARPPLVAGEPEVRRYRVRYLDGDVPTGMYSAVVSVTTIP
jgi:hypothetical protein